LQNLEYSDLFTFSQSSPYSGKDGFQSVKSLFW